MAPPSTRSFSATQAAIAEATGVVIPLYLPATVPDRAAASRLIADNLAAWCRQVGDPQRVCLSVDGREHGGDLGAALAAEHGVTLHVAPENGGKLQAVTLGARVLLARPELRYLALVDHDGDHFAHELPNFVAAAQQVEAEAGTDRVHVLGRRLSRHRPMGFLRGELEELADRMLLDALQYHAALSQQPLCLEFATLLDEFPDFCSGYKLLTRPVAEAVFGPALNPVGMAPAAVSRHVVEPVITVEAYLAGARLAVVNRSTLNQQPLTVFGQFSRTRMTADKILWPCRRLGVPPAFVRQWLDNHLPRLLLSSLVPQGADELREIRRLVLIDLGLPPTPEPSRPAFL